MISTHTIGLCMIVRDEAQGTRGSLEHCCLMNTALRERRAAILMFLENAAFGLIRSSIKEAGPDQ